MMNRKQNRFCRSLSPLVLVIVSSLQQATVRAMCQLSSVPSCLPACSPFPEIAYANVSAMLANDTSFISDENASITVKCHSGFNSSRGQEYTSLCTKVLDVAMELVSWRWVPSAVPCLDINECSDNPCHSSAACYNQPGSFTCACTSPQTGDGKKTCTRANNITDAPTSRSMTHIATSKLHSDDKVSKDYIIYGAAISGSFHLVSLVIIICLLLRRRRAQAALPTVYFYTNNGQSDVSLGRVSTTTVSETLSESNDLEDSFMRKSTMATQPGRTSTMTGRKPTLTPQPGRKSTMSNQPAKKNSRGNSLKNAFRKRTSTFRDVQSPRGRQPYMSEPVSSHSMDALSEQFGKTDEYLVENFPNVQDNSKVGGYTSTNTFGTTAGRESTPTGRERKDTFT